MTYLSEIYGKNFKEDSAKLRVDQYTNFIATNIANREFKFKIPDMLKAAQYDPNGLESMISKINKSILCIRLDTRTEDLKTIPVLIINKPTNYFVIIDMITHKSYVIYITPDEVDAY